VLKGRAGDRGIACIDVGGNADGTVSPAGKALGEFGCRTKWFRSIVAVAINSKRKCAKKHGWPAPICDV